jgi:hypothetical protein
MQKVVVAKIKSVLKTLLRRKTLLIILAMLCVILPFVFYQPNGAMLRVGDSSYRLTIAATDAKRQQGLSNRTEMASDRGMLFVYDKPGSACLWMKDMRFSLDMIWLDVNKKVVHVEQNVTPESYPNQFCSDKPAKYIVELNSGEVARAGVRVGQTLHL